MLVNLKSLVSKVFLHISNFKLIPFLHSSTKITLLSKKHALRNMSLNILSQFIHNKNKQAMT